MYLKLPATKKVQHQSQIRNKFMSLRSPPVATAWLPGFNVHTHVSEQFMVQVMVQIFKRN